MDITPTTLPEVKLIKAPIHHDDRGFFQETYRKDILRNSGITCDFVQDNHSRSDKGTLRGLHYQRAPMGQDKLVRCTRGRIIDVAVDMRPDSPRYLQWVSVELSSQNHHMLFIPKEFAHGFYTLEDTTDVHYKCSHYYEPKYEEGVMWNDPKIGIKWPLVTPTPIVSKKDLSYSLL